MEGSGGPKQIITGRPKNLRIRRIRNTATNGKECYLTEFVLFNQIQKHTVVYALH
jgi:hypothetical protein